MGFDRLLREEEASTDLTVDEAVGDELKNLQLPARRLLLDAERRTKGNDLAAGCTSATLRDFLEPSRVVDITAQDLTSLGSVHGPGYRPSAALSSPSIQGLPSTALGGARQRIPRAQPVPGGASS